MIKPYKIDLAIHKAAQKLGLDPWGQPFNMRINPGDLDEVMSYYPEYKDRLPADGILRGTIRNTKADHRFSIVPDDSIPPGSVEVEFVTK